MSREVVVLDEAETELEEAERWYESRRPGLGSEFIEAINEVMGRLSVTTDASLPVLGVSDTVGARRLLVKRFPYAVVFLETSEEIWVIAFAHHRRRPGYWRHRLS